MKDQLLKLRLGEEDDMEEEKKGEEGRQVKSCAHLYLSLCQSGLSICARSLYRRCFSLR